tara:strand:- start:3491 stop:3802 length:312 start_codon:yes stop_codon:yes gene_type:complete
MQYIEIIQTQSATVVETIKVRVLVPEGMSQEEFRYHLDDEGIASEFTEVHEDDAYIQYDNDDPEDGPVAREQEVFVGTDTEGVKIERSFDWHDPDIEMKDVTK